MAHELDLESHRTSDFKADEVIALFEDLVANRDAIVREIGERSTEYSDLVEAQYRQMGELLGYTVPVVT